MKRVYADYAAATPIDDRVLKVVTDTARQYSGNPSSLHSFGQEAADVLTTARESVASFLNAASDEVYFTSSGTESNNLALIGIAKANRERGNHIITTSIEHPSVLNACRALERDGFIVTYLPVDHEGRVALHDFTAAITPQTILASIHLANSEIGVIQPIAELSEVARAHAIPIHTDACQAAAFAELNIKSLGVDALSFNGSKLYGPRGVAALYVRESVSIFPLLYGGGQEQSLRSGSENLSGVVGLAEACRIAAAERVSDARRISRLRDQLQATLQSIGCQVNCASTTRLPNHLSVTIPTGKANIVDALNRRGIAVSSGSACSSRSQTESHVLVALGFNSSQINRTIRISLGRQTTKKETEVIAQLVGRI